VGRGGVVIDHVYISVTNIEKSLAFYLEALKPLGWAGIGHYDAANVADFDGNRLEFVPKAWNSAR
jgi:hypothetical protein